MAAVNHALPQLRVAGDITQLVGHTPMLQLTRLSSEPGAQVFAKLEFLNPGGSIKDRAALGMILDAESRGLLRPGATILEATAGNTGVGLALIGVNRGYKVMLFVPEGFAEEKCILMRGFGAEVARTPESEGMAGAIRRANEAAAAIPGAFMAGQFSNQANPTFHHDTTAAEIWEQLEGRVDAFVCGVGTGGTFSGIARFLKERDPGCVTVAVETEGSILQGGPPGKHRVEGIGVSFIPETFHRDVCDRVVMVKDDDAFAMVKRLAAEEGLVGGSSSGANVHAALEIARELGPGKRVATIIPDSAERYLSKKISKGEFNNLKAGALALLIAFLVIPPAFAQPEHGAAPLPSFEVASINPTAPGGQVDGSWSPPGIGQFWARGLSLKYLIHLAFDIDLNQIAGKQPWLDSVYFDVTAKPEEGIALSRAELRPRLQNLLQTRFHLVTHYDTRMDQGYILVVAKGGSKLTPTKGDKFPGFRIDVSPGHLEGINWSMDYLAAMLQQAAGRPVANQTGIAGSYDVKAEFAPDIETDSTLPSIFTALKSTLGLELKPQRIPVQVLVIDSVDRTPAPN